MQGFVSNKDSEEEGKGDPLEALLYAVFVASSERASVAELAGILSVKVPKLQMAISIACRLGFGTRLPPAGPQPLLLTASPPAATLLSAHHDLTVFYQKMTHCSLVTVAPLRPMHLRLIDDTCVCACMMRKLLSCNCEDCVYM